MIRSLSLAILLGCLSLPLAAQNGKPDSLRNKLTKSNLSALDTASIKLTKGTDSIRSLSQKLTHLQDSIQPKFGKQRSKLDSLKGKIQASDSLKNNLVNYNRKLDSIKGKLSHRIDSLSSLGLPTGKYTKLLDSLKQAGPMKNISEAQGKLAALQSKVNEPMRKIGAPIEKVESKINEKLSLMNREGGGGANLPGSIDLPNVNTPALGSPGLPGTEMRLPSADINNPLSELKNPLSEVKNPTGKIEGLGGVQEKMKEVSAMPQKELGEIKGMDELKKAQGAMGQVNEVTGKIDGYSKDVKTLSSGNLNDLEQLPKELENSVGKLDEVQGIQKQTQALDQYKKMAADDEALKQQVVQEVQKQAVDHFAGQGEQLKAAMDHMSKLKEKYTSLQNMKDLPKRVPNEMTGKPWIERFVPGITLQIQKNSNVMIDFNPLIGYRISGRFTAGAGWNERMSFGKKLKLNSQDRIYGPRLFVDFKIKKGFSLRAEGERMNTFIPTLTSQALDDKSRAWVSSIFAGIKKDYQFMKGMRGNFQLLYNLYDDHDNSPYQERLNVRMGFEFPLKKKKSSQAK